jgi:diguanylate cyclase (GGDEF)-like protein
VLGDEVARQRRTGQTLSLVLIDADHFKLVNDQYGDDMGDKVLRTLGKLLMACVRSPTDVACRLGGEEFALILPDTRHEQAEALCQRLREQLAQVGFDAGDHAFKVTLSMGLAEGRVLDAEHLLRKADQQLYRAKESGRDRVCVADALGDQRAAGGPA